jgi:uncharacterized membrane protein (DUF4010 family)
MISFSTPQAFQLLIAFFGGLTVGAEREWSARSGGRSKRFAGVRTFILLSLLGAAASQLAVAGQPLVAAVVAAGGVSLTVVAYAVAARQGELDGTTEVAALVVIGGGCLAGVGQAALAGGVYATTALVLAEKSKIHTLVHTLRGEELSAGVRFAALALVVLPLLPKGPFGPEPGFRPQELWALVLAFSGVSFGGYIAIRAAGPDRGYGLAGLLGGLISSTAVTLSFARESRSRPEWGESLGLGVIAANTMLYFRVLVVASALSPAFGGLLMRWMWIPLTVGVAASLLAFHFSERRPGGESRLDNPLRLGPAFQMAIAFQLILYAVPWIERRYGASGVVASAAVLGLTDVDALTYSMAKLCADPNRMNLAAVALSAGALANAGLKLVCALVIGSGAFRRVAALGLLALTLGTGGALALFHAGR